MRWTASAASASSRLASRRPRLAPALVPTSRSGSFTAAASQAASSSAAQSCTPPPNGTKPPSPRVQLAPGLRVARRRRPSARAARRRRRGAGPRRHSPERQGARARHRTSTPGGRCRLDDVLSCAGRCTSRSRVSRRAFNAAEAEATSSPAASRRATMSSRACTRANGAASPSKPSMACPSDGSTSTGRRDRSVSRSGSARSSERSWVRIARSSIRQPESGSIPNCSTRASRVADRLGQCRLAAGSNW